MSRLAETQRSVRQHWALPGGSHDRIVGLLKNLLPAGVGVLAAFLAVAPFARDGEVSFVLDKNDVDVASERLKVREALYRGEDNQGRPFSLRAGSAVQKSSRDPEVNMKDLSARLLTRQGPAVLTAGQGRYNLESQRMAVEGPVQFDSAQGYRLTTRDVTIDLKSHKLDSAGRVYGRTPTGTFDADRLQADLDTHSVTLVGNARLRIEQNGIKGR